LSDNKKKGGFFMYNSDWHIHSEASYDASLSVEELIASAKDIGLKQFGITDHANLNISSFWENMYESKRLYKKYQCKGFYYGVELTPIPKSLYEYCAKHGTKDGYTFPSNDKPCELEFMLTLEDIEKLGIMNSVAAAHSVLNIEPEQDKVIYEWHRQQMYIATDPRVDILGHPWWFWGNKEWQDSEGRYLDKPWFSNFDVIPRSMHNELAAALIENEVCIEANLSMICGKSYPENFYRKYNEYLRYMFEKGVKLVFGSDTHKPPYRAHHESVENALGIVGFKPEDFSTPRIHNRAGTKFIT
jgi:histidinol phosphatase-like PHP family hydrolase